MWNGEKVHVLKEKFPTIVSVLFYFLKKVSEASSHSPFYMFPQKTHFQVCGNSWKPSSVIEDFLNSYQFPSFLLPNNQG